MAAVKLNTFHWHITDSQSFPFEVSKRPQLSKLGALTPAKVSRQSFRISIFIKKVLEVASPIENCESNNSNTGCKSKNISVHAFRLS